jgi:hypothetical protein
LKFKDHGFTHKITLQIQERKKCHDNFGLVKKNISIFQSNFVRNFFAHFGHHSKCMIITKNIMPYNEIKKMTQVATFNLNMCIKNKTMSKEKN